MNMSPYLPPGSSDVATLSALLQVLVDPAEAKKVLDKIAAEEKKLDELIAKHTQLLNETTEAAKASEQALQKISGEKIALQQKQIVISQKERDLNGREAAFAVRETSLQLKERELADKTSAFDALQGVHARETNALATRQKALETREKELAASIAKYNQWLKTIKPPEA